MTIRETIERQTKLGFLGEIIAAGLILSGVALGTWFEPWPLEKALWVAGFVVLGVSVVYLLGGVRCPKCGHPMLWSNVNWGGLQVWSVRKAKECPFCHVDLDSDLNK